jgi:hypothetical protein
MDATAVQSSEARASVLITINTPESNTPICRLASSEDVVGELTVRQLVERIISPNSLFSVGVPLGQLETESPTALAIGELLSADCCEVFVAARGQQDPRSVELDASARSTAREQVGSQGNRFLNITLDIRSKPDMVASSGEDRRRLAVPDSAEAALTANGTGDADDIPAPSAILGDGAAVPMASSGSAQGAQPPSSASTPEPEKVDAADETGLTEGAEDAATAPSIVTIVAEPPKEEPKAVGWDRKEYVRKTDWLRAQFLPEVDALDFSGLFVGNLGIGVREEKSRRNVVLADPSRITDVLLRANGYRRSGDHAKALICYQELVDMDPGNADFRFLLGKTMIELGQYDDAAESLARAKELGHDGADKELDKLRRDGHRQRTPLGFLRFWKQ